MSENNFVYADSLFPTFVMYVDNKDLISKDILEQSRSILQKDGNKPFYSPCLSTVATNGSILELMIFKEIKTFISNCVGFYCDHTKIKKDNLRFSCSWLNSYNKGDYQDLHAHSDSILSGVFYLKSAEKKDLIFQAPWHFFQATCPEYTEININNCHNAEYPSVEGRCYVFPSHLMHRTLPATSERISLSFNVKYQD